MVEKCLLQNHNERPTFSEILEALRESSIHQLLPLQLHKREKVQHKLEVEEEPDRVTKPKIVKEVRKSDGKMKKRADKMSAVATLLRSQKEDYWKLGNVPLRLCNTNDQVERNFYFFLLPNLMISN